MLKARRIRRHVTSEQEIEDLRAVVSRDLRDARVAELSADRRFATAYNAVLQLAKMVLACSGYRAAGPGHHETTLEALEIAMGSGVADTAVYFDVCRRKRHQLDYDFADAATATEAEELIEKAEEFRELVEEWIRRRCPQLAR
ncbi:MAG: SAV_6107 family HEPN domain-containing protein [Bryobacteraceae bacterium]